MVAAPVLTSRSTIDRLRRAAPGRKARASRVPDEHHRLVHWGIRRWLRLTPLHADYDDAYQHGMQTVVHTAECFDSMRGTTFSTYATGALFRSLTRWNEARLRHGFSGLTTLPYTAVKPSSLTGTTPGDKDVDVIDQRETGPEAETSASNRFEASADLATAIEQLTPREQMVIRRRWWGAETLSEVAADLRVTKERVRQIDLAARKKLKQYLQLDGSSETYRGQPPDREEA